MRRSSVLRSFLVILVVAVLPSCESGPPPIESVTINGVTSVSFTFIGETRTLTVSLVDTDGSPRTDVAVTWTSTNASAADVSPAGLVTARGNGTATITAMAGGVSSGSVIVSVDQRATTVNVATTSVSLSTIGETRVLAATATDQGNSPVAGASFQWTSSRSDVATVTAAGVVTAEGEGTSTVRASADGVASNPVTVEVDQVATSVDVIPSGPITLGFLGEMLTLTASARDGGGALIANPGATWSSSNNGVATFNTPGVLRAIGEGSAEVRATVDGIISQPVTVNVELGVLVLAKGDRLPNLSAPFGQGRLFQIDVPAGVGELYVSLGGGTGDPDLFMRRGAHPVPDFEDPVNDCASGAAAGGPAGCPFIDPAPGDWFILIDAFSAYDEWTLRAWYEEGPSGLNIEFVDLIGLSPSAWDAMEDAADRWAATLPKDLQPSLLALPGPTFSSPPCGVDGVVLSDLVEDIIVYVGLIADSDGPGGTLASAGPNIFRSAGDDAITPIVGCLGFDDADLDDLLATGQFPSTALHELGHILGIGTFWETTDPPLIQGAGTADPIFVGPLATQAFDDVGGTAYQGAKIPVENTGGEGTADGHWRETVFEDELMTGLAEGAGIPEKLSNVTIQALADQGWTVDANQADAYQLPAGGGAAARVGNRLGVQLLDDILRMDLYALGEDGQITLVRRGQVEAPIRRR